MLRGVSLAPQQRAVKDLKDLPSELKNSLLGGMSFGLPADYGSTGGGGGGGAGSAPTSENVSSPLVQHGAAGGTPAAHVYSQNQRRSLFSRLFRSAKQRYRTAFTGQVPVFDYNGNLTTNQVGVNTFRFRSLSLFYFFRSQPWKVLLTYSAVLYLLIVLLITCAYYVWGVACGAGMNTVMAVYFTVVSLAANGGYMGEDVGTMADSTHVCYRGRTVIVMVCSYVNILFVGLMAAVVVGKAEYAGKLGHRVVFSDFCTLTSVPGRVDQWRLVFRMANVDNHIPLAHGKLRLFCVTAEPLKEYRLRQQQRQLMRHARPIRGLTNTSFGGSHHVLHGLEAGLGSRHGPLRTSKPGSDGSDHRRRRADKAHKKRIAVKGHASRYSELAPPPAASSSSPTTHEASTSTHAGGGREEESGLTRAQRHQRRRKHQRHPRKHPKAAAAGAGEGGEGAVEGRRPRQRQVRPRRADRRRHGAGSDEDADVRPGSGAASRSTSASSSGTESTLSSSSATSRTSTPHSSRGSSPSRKVGRRQVSSRQVHTSSTIDDAASDKTNTSVSSQEDSCLYASSPVAPNAGGRRGVLPPPPLQNIRERSVPVRIASQFPDLHAEDETADEDDGNALERVRLRVQEMRWTCAEESYLDRGDSGQLSLWYPVNITHTIDERSPLHPFMELPSVAASLSGASGVAEVPSAWTRRAEVALQRFQIVAVFDATEMESGSTITAKRTYTTADIAAHYKFSDRLVHIQADSSEVVLDFHYFNALLPVDLVEPSTTDSDL